MGSVRVAANGAGGVKSQRSFTTSTSQVSVYVRVRFPTLAGTWAVAWTIQDAGGNSVSIIYNQGTQTIQFDNGGTTTTIISTPVAGAWYDFAVAKNGANCDVAYKLASDSVWSQSSIATATFTPTTFTFGSYPGSEALATQPVQYGKIVVFSAVQGIATVKAEAEPPAGAGVPTRSLRAGSNVYFYNDCASAASFGTDAGGAGNNFTLTGGGSITDQDADPQFGQPLLLCVQSIAAVFSAAGGTTVAPTWGGVSPGLQGVDLLFVGGKPVNSGGWSTNNSFRRLGSLHAAGGYGGASGVDNGDSDLWVGLRPSSPLTSGTLTVTVGSGGGQGVSWGKILRVKALTRARVEALASFAQQTAAGNLSVTFTQNPNAWKTRPGDLIVACFGSPTDINTTTQYSSVAIAQTGVTFTSTAFEVFQSSAGNDIGGFLAYWAVTAGYGKDPPVLSATINVANSGTTNVRGPATFIRLRAGAPGSALAAAA